MANAIKKHGRLAKSIFRVGLDLLQDGLKNLTSTIKPGAVTINSSNIKTTANTGDSGAINVNGGELIYLKDSGFKTTVRIQSKTTSRFRFSAITKC